MPARRTFLAMSACAPLLLGRIAHGASEPDFAAVNKDIALHHIAPRYAAFAHACAALAETLTAYAADRATLDDARTAFHDTMDAWQGVQHLRFGPSQVDARQFQIQYWPDSRNRIGRQLGEVLSEERPDLISDPQAMAQASIAIQGLPALERLLFELDPVPSGYASLLAAAIGDNLKQIASDLEAEWRADSDWSRGLHEPGSSDVAYPEPSQASAALLLSLITQLEIVASAKLREPLGETQERARPRLSESWRSGRSIRNAFLNIDALADLYGGGEGRFEKLLIGAGQEDLAADIARWLENARQVLVLLPDDMEGVISDSSQRTSALAGADALYETRMAVEQSAAPALGLTLGFNSLDGD